MAPKLPPANAELTLIEAFDYIGVDELGNETVGLDEVWSGSAPAHLRTRTIFNHAPSGTVTDQFLELSIPSNLVTEIHPGFRLTFRRGISEQTISADEVEDRVDLGYFRIIANKERATA